VVNQGDTCVYSNPTLLPLQDRRTLSFVLDLSLIYLKHPGDMVATFTGTPVDWLPSARTVTFCCNLMPVITHTNRFKGWEQADLCFNAPSVMDALSSLPARLCLPLGNTQCIVQCVKPRGLKGQVVLKFKTDFEWAHVKTAEFFIDGARPREDFYHERKPEVKVPPSELRKRIADELKGMQHELERMHEVYNAYGPAKRRRISGEYTTDEDSSAPPSPMLGLPIECHPVSQ